MATEEAFPVHLYVYDLSNGLAKSLSLQLTGRQFDAIYHTSIVVHGREYYFGQGIFTSNTPGQTHFGAPIERIDMGKTAVDADTLQEILNDLRERYTAQAYHLLNFNCNTFSNELANIIVGRDIPARITSLPQDFLATPFGQMMGPQIDAMFRGSVNGNGSRAASAMGAQSAHASPSAMGILNSVTRSAMSNGYAHQHGQPSSSYTGGLRSNGVRHIESIAQFDEVRRAASSAVIMFTSHTCPPCVQLHPVYESLAERYTSGGKANDRPIIFGQVESSANTVQLMQQQGISATPTIQFFERGVKVNELKGANPASLEDAIEALLWRLHRPHPHSKLHDDPLASVPGKGIQYKTIPNVTNAMQKLNELTSKHKADTFDEKADMQDARSALAKGLVPWISNGLAVGKRVPMSDVDILRWVKGAQRCIELLECKDLFPVVDFVRIALLDEGQCRTLAQSENSVILTNICAKVRQGMTPDNKATLLTTYRLVGNVLASDEACPTLAQNLAHNEDVTALLVYGILYNESGVRSAAISTAFNWARVHGKRRSTFVRAVDVNSDNCIETQDENVDAEVEVLCAVLECLDAEQDVERVHRAGATLVLLLHCVPAWQTTVQPLLEVIEASRRIEEKLSWAKGETTEADKTKMNDVIKLLEIARKLCSAS